MAQRMNLSGLMSQWNQTWINGSHDGPVGDDEDSFELILQQYRDSLLTLTDTTTIILLTLYVPIFLVSVIGNILVLVVIVPNRQLQSVTNNFLLNLAIADLLVSVVCIPMTAAQRVYQLWIYGDILCRATPYLQGIAVSASTFTITGMSLDRCLAIRHPVTFRQLRTTKTVRILIFCVWIISLIIMIPILLVRKTVTDEILPGEKFTYCIEIWPTANHRQGFDLFILVIVYVCPGLVISVCYVTMSQRLWIPDKHLNTSGNKTSFREGSNNITSGRRRLAKMCIAVAILFALCWLPYYILNTYISFKPDVHAANVVHFMLLVGHFHSATNPVLYCFLHKTFRHYLKRFMFSGFKLQVGENSKLLSKGALSQKSPTTKTFKSSFHSSNSVRRQRQPYVKTGDGNSLKICSDDKCQPSFLSGTNDSSSSNLVVSKSDVMNMTNVTQHRVQRHVSLSVNGTLYETRDISRNDKSMN